MAPPSPDTLVHVARQRKGASAREVALNLRIAALAARLPTVRCQGLCADYCGPIGMTVEEYDSIIQARGGKLLDDVLDVDGSIYLVPQNLLCPLLKDGRCTVYRLRPLICRAYGCVEGLECPYGCQPTPGYMSDAEFTAMLIEAGMMGPPTSQAEARRMVAETPFFEQHRSLRRGRGRVAPGFGWLVPDRP